MPNRFDHDALVDKALASLVEIMKAHKAGPVMDRAMLRFVLAFLYRDDRKPFDTFYREAIRDTSGDVDATRFGHFQALRGAYGAITRLHGRDYW